MEKINHIHMTMPLHPKEITLNNLRQIARRIRSKSYPEFDPRKDFLVFCCDSYQEIATWDLPGYSKCSGKEVGLGEDFSFIGYTESYLFVINPKELDDISYIKWGDSHHQ